MHETGNSGLLHFERAHLMIFLTKDLNQTERRKWLEKILLLFEENVALRSYKKRPLTVCPCDFEISFKLNTMDLN